MLTELVHEERMAEVFLKSCPCKSLQRFIEFYRETKHQGGQFPIRYLPNLAFTIRFNLGNEFSLRNERKSFVFNDHILVANNQTWVDDGRCFAIKFRLGLLPYLLGVSYKSFLERPVTVRDLLCPEFIMSIEKAGSFEERVKLSENYFVLLYEKNRNEVAKYRVVEEVVNHFSESSFDFRIAERMKKSFVSSKSLQRYFIKNFGLSPKSVYCIVRMRKALESYFSNSTRFRVYDFDYYDHSHFYREIKRLVGLNLPQLKSDNITGSD